SNADEYAFFSKYILRIPTRIGFRFKNRGRFLNFRKEIPSGFVDHPVTSYYLSLLEFLTSAPRASEKKLYFYVDPKDETWAFHFLKDHSVVPKDMKICLLPGGGASWGNQAHLRFWPSHHFVEIGKKLIQKYKARLILIGSPQEKAVCDDIQRQIPYPVINAAGLTTLGQLASLMKASDLVVGSECGPLHLATALDVKNIAIYGPVSPTVYGPYSDTPHRQTVIFHALPCRPCYKDFRIAPCFNQLCLKELEADTVFKSIENVLATFVDSAPKTA
ncbi:MAG: glycosyltransferase family 9 protein, partial [Deltaproteobacteria bacterium]|nr:glycosyltransferase family 9 protein [Deltaproteobacteria bacterium]